MTNHNETTNDGSDESQRQRLVAELDRLIERVRAAAPEYRPPPFSAERLLHLIDRSLTRLAPQMRLALLERLRAALASDLFDVDTWKGIWYVANYTVEARLDVVKRRLRGDYETDAWGLDQDVLDVFVPFFQFLYRAYWRVEAIGLENVPAEGRGLLVANHSGQLPWDGAMVASAIFSEHPAGRLVRTLYGSIVPTLPFVSELFVKLGQVLATEDNGVRLLEADELVAVFPEGYKGLGKLFRERYRLARFGRGGFVRMALRTGAPLIPVAVVGAEESFVSVAKSPRLAELFGLPYFPISPTFPWLGLLGLVPLPTKWTIEFGAPISLDGYEPDAADDVILVAELTERVRGVIQDMLYARLAQRQSIFLG
jgi:1-acyl-sn-glycerol-3-phosphate acyltransferase